MGLWENYDDEQKCGKWDEKSTVKRTELLGGIRRAITEKAYDDLGNILKKSINVREHSRID